MSAEVIVCGSLNMDLVARVAQLPRPGETVVGVSLARLPGGKGLNQGHIHRLHPNRANNFTPQIVVRLIEQMTLLLLSLKDLYFFKAKKRLFHKACHAAYKLL